MPSQSIKLDARQLVDKLPENATWDDLMYEIYVRQAIEAGLRDSKEGRTTDLIAVRGVRVAIVNVHLTATARRHLWAIHDYIAKDSVRYAQRMVDRILHRIEQLADFPLIGWVVEEYESDDVREIVEPPYRIIYRIKPEQVDVLAIIHGARQLPPLPNE